MNSTICCGARSRLRRKTMGTLTEEIFSRRLGREVNAGEIVVAPVDYAMAHDVTGPLAIEAFRKLDVPLWDPERVIMVFDHILPRSEEHTSELQSHVNLVCRLLLEKKKKNYITFYLIKKKKKNNKSNK